MIYPDWFISFIVTVFLIGVIVAWNPYEGGEP